MADGKQENLRKRLLELSHDPEIVEKVMNALIVCLDDPKIKIGDALKVYELLHEAQTEDAASILPDDLPDTPDDLEWNRYSDDELRAMLNALESGSQSEEPRAASAYKSASASPASTHDNPFHLNLGDFLHD